MAGTSGEPAFDGAAPWGLSSASWEQRGYMDISCVSTNHAIYHRAWRNPSWVPYWENLGGYAPAHTSQSDWCNGSYQLWVRGGDNKIYARGWNGSWGGWTGPYANTATSPATVVNGGRLDLFFVSTDQNMWQGTQVNNGPFSWFNHGNPGMGFAFLNPGACSLSGSPLRFDIFGLGNNGYLYQRSYWAPNWGPWTIHGAAGGAGISAACSKVGSAEDIWVFVTSGVGPGGYGNVNVRNYSTRSNWGLGWKWFRQTEWGSISFGGLGGGGSPTGPGNATGQVGSHSQFPGRIDSFNGYFASNLNSGIVSHTVVTL